MEVKIKKAEVIEILMKHLVIVFPDKKIIEITGSASIPNEFTFEVTEPEEVMQRVSPSETLKKKTDKTADDTPNWAKEILEKE